MELRNRLGFRGKWVFCVCEIIAVLIGAGTRVRADVDPKFYAVMVSAQVQSSPAQVNLRWASDPQASSYRIYRRNDSSWQQVGSVAGGVNSWTDTSVSDGGTYEYRVHKDANGYQGVGFVLAGINAPLKETHGKVVLLVDNSFSSALSAELKRLEWDLAGDGWTVLRHDVARNDSVVNIKNVIRGDYDEDRANVKAVFAFGHVPVPYSGNFNPDNHEDHRGAWPADLYYGDMDGSWTDNSVSVGAAKPWNNNSPGDGKFDQSSLPSPVELAVGRVDFNNMTCFANKSPSRSELDLLRAYLNKDHNFRHRVFTVARRGLVSDNFGNIYGESFAASGWRNFASFFGAENITAVGNGQFFPTVTQQDYLWSYGTGGGSYYTCAGVGGSDDFAVNEVRTVFTMFLGSYFGDWDNESNFLRAPLGSGYCLTSSWAGRPHWFYHHMALGEPIGTSTLASQNNIYGDVTPTVNQYAGYVHVALLGDPTLRMHPVLPASNLEGSASGSSLSLTWSPSGDSDLQGYHVYRGGGPNGQFARLTSAPIASTSFLDTSYTAGSTYMVRAVKLERSGSGTYFNASQGVFFPENGAGGGSSGGTSGGTTGGGPLVETPAAPGTLVATTQSPSSVALSWKDNASNEAGFRIDRKLGSSGSWVQAGVANANTTTYTVTGLSPGSTYFFRVFAQNSGGVSMPSNESTATTLLANPINPGAVFLGANSAVQGNWRGEFGADGYDVITGGSSYPGYAMISAAGKADYQWSDYATEARALVKPSGTGRVIGAWFSPTTFTIDVNLLDGLNHKVSLYFVDWDRVNRTQKIEVLDAVSGAILDTQTISNFGNGVYLSWSLKGQVRFRLTRVAGNNVIVNGLFFDNSPKVRGNSASGLVISDRSELQINGEVGQRFDIFRSENLSNWTKISTITLPSSSFDFSDSTFQGQPRRFYRAVAVP